MRNEGGPELKLLLWLLVACSGTLCLGDLQGTLALKRDILETVAVANVFYATHFPEHQTLEHRIGNITRHFESIPTLHTLNSLVPFSEHAISSYNAKATVFFYGMLLNIPADNRQTISILEKEFVQVGLKFDSFEIPSNAIPVTITHYTKRSYPYLSTDSTLAPLTDVVSIHVGTLSQFDSLILSVLLHVDAEYVDSLSDLKCGSIEGDSFAWRDHCETQVSPSLGTVMCRCPISGTSSGLVTVTALNVRAFCGRSPGDEYYCLDGKRWHSKRSVQYDTLYLPSNPMTIQGNLTTNLIVSMAPTSTLTVTGCVIADSVLLVFDADQANQLISSKGATLPILVTYGNCDISHLRGEAIISTDGRCESITPIFNHASNAFIVELKVNKDACKKKSIAWKIVVGCVFGVIGLCLIAFIIFVVVPYVRRRLRRREEIRANTYYYDDSKPKTTDVASTT